MIAQEFIDRIAKEIRVSPEQVAAAIPLFDKGSSVPFVARYRKDATGNLDEARLERIAELNTRYTAFSNRRTAVIDNVEAQGGMTDALRKSISSCSEPAALEDLYLGFKKVRRTRACAGRDAGLQPLTDALLAQDPEGKPAEELAAAYAKPGTPYGTADAALQGARDILAEHFAVDPKTRGSLRKTLFNDGKFVAKATKNAEGNARYKQFYDLTEPVKSIAPEKLLNMLRGVRFAMLRLDIQIDDDAFLSALQSRYIKDANGPYAAHLRQALEDAYRRLLRPELESEVMEEVRTRAEDVLIATFRRSAEEQLMSPGLGAVAMLGIHPASENSFILAAVGADGAPIETAEFQTTEEARAAGAETIKTFIEKHAPIAVAIGNSPGSRNASRLVTEAVRDIKDSDVFYYFVNEAGAQAYASSKIGKNELPDLSQGARTAVSVARRLQDPMKELVKLEPRDIAGVPNQFDINQRHLREALFKTIESCVTRVGADLNTAPADLLRYISGIQLGTAQNMVAYRNEHGGFKTRKQLIDVPGIGEKTFEQCAGFLRVQGGENPLDATHIHPEAYETVGKFAEQAGVSVAELQNNNEKLAALDLAPLATETLGTRALEDLRRELRRPGKDPRRKFERPRYGRVTSVLQLEEGITVEGVVTNVTDFGAFVDIGIHQDGLIHLSELANHFVRDPREVLHVGQVVEVKVVKVDRSKERVSLSRKALQAPPEGRPRRAPADGDRGPVRGEGDSKDRRPARGEGRSQDRDRKRGDGDRPRKPRRNQRNDGPPSRNKQASRLGMQSTVKHGDSKGTDMNTLLADQLSALKDKLGK